MPDDIIHTHQQLGALPDLLDHEIQEMTQIVMDVQLRYQHRHNTAHNLSLLRDEILTRLAGIGILATVDPAPCFYNEAPVVEIIGKVGDQGFHQAFDHEQKAYEVRKATQRGEDYLGQKERADARVPKADVTPKLQES